MKTPPLFDIPKDSPSRHEKIQAFKVQHRIWTHYWAGGRKDGEAWSGMILPTDIGGTDCSKMEPEAIIAKWGILLEDLGNYVTGPSEVEIIRQLCSQNNIICPL